MLVLKWLFKIFLYNLSKIVFRSNKIWVVGSYGVFNDNSRYLFLNTHQLNIRMIWIAKSKKELLEVRSHNKECYYRYSLKGVYFCLRAKVYIYSAYINDINYITSGGALWVNLWHGIPLKKIEFDIKNGEISKVFDGSVGSIIRYPWIYRKADLLLSPSAFVNEYSFIKAFRASSIVVDLYPRVKALKELGDKKKYLDEFFTFLYAPTWRDHSENFFEEAGIDFDTINKFCVQNNAKFLIKLHPNSKCNIDVSSYSNINILNNQYDSNEILVKSDCLITDYSSIYFDYMVLKKPIIFFRFDEVIYREKSREFYDEVYNLLPGENVVNTSELLIEMDCIMRDKFILKKEYKDLFEILEIDKYYLKNNSNLLIDEILKLSK